MNPSISVTSSSASTLIVSGEGMTWSDTSASGWRTTAGLNMSIDDFMKLEDNDLKKRIFSSREIGSEHVTKKVDDEEKTAYYLIEKTVKMNNKGVFYVNNFLTEWISYNKSTKKVKVSKRTPNVLKMLMKEHFGSNWEMMSEFVKRITPTFCKKVMEGKITCLRNVMEYHKSYTVRKKELDSNTIARFAVENELYSLHSIEDPENFYSFDKLGDIDVSFWSIKPFKFKSEEIDDVAGKYKKWCGEQDKKLDTLRRLRNGKAGNKYVQDTKYQAPVVSDKLFKIRKI